MRNNRLRPMAFRFAFGSVLGAALLVGTAYGDASAKGSRSDTVQLKRADEKAVARAEQAVAKSPRDAALRAALGQHYLRAGRFASATGAFTDAMALGESTPRTALGLALANIGTGRHLEARAILDSSRDGIPASDLGLALALTGDTGRGVAILSDALRGGDDSPKTRQNLAYAYALNGNWREARLMMAQDAPAEQLDARMTQWLASSQPALYQQRVAALIGAPVRSDPGFPQHLALNAAPETAQAAAEVAPAPAPAPVAELPPVEQASAFVPAPTPIVGLSASTEAPTEASPPVAAPAPVGSQSLAAFEEFSRPVSTSFAVAPAPVRQARAAKAPLRASHTAARPSSGGSHVVQLGSFSSEQNARRAWNVFVSRSPELKGARMVITPAVVNGRNFWRVAAASYDPSSAQGLCSSIKARGGSCFAYTTTGQRANLAMVRTELRSGAGLALARR